MRSGAPISDPVLGVTLSLGLNVVRWTSVMTKGPMLVSERGLVALTTSLSSEHALVTVLVVDRRRADDDGRKDVTVEWESPKVGAELK